MTGKSYDSPCGRFTAKAEMWEPGEWVVTLGGAPVGGTFGSAREAESAAGWLVTALGEILRILAPDGGEGSLIA